MESVSEALRGRDYPAPSPITRCGRSPHGGYRAAILAPLATKTCSRKTNKPALVGGTKLRLSVRPGLAGEGEKITHGAADLGQSGLARAVSAVAEGNRHLHDPAAGLMDEPE